jgi:hypothetical protein
MTLDSRLTLRSTLKFKLGNIEELEMNKSGMTLSAALVMSALLVALAGCEKKEGPVEKAGKEVDKATEQVGRKIENAGEKVQDAVKGDK